MSLTSCALAGSAIANAALVAARIENTILENIERFFICVRCSLFTYQLHAAIARTAFGRFVRIDRTRLAVARCREPIRLEAIAGDQRHFYCGGPAFGEIQIEGVTRDAVGMAIDGELPVGM